MANDRIVYRTNAFSVTDEEEWRGLYNRLSDKDNVKDLEAYGFHTLESTNGIRASFDEEVDIAKDFTKWTEDLQKILPKNEAFMLVSSYYEDDEHTGNSVTIVTPSSITYDDMPDDIYLQAVGLKDTGAEGTPTRPTADDIREELQNVLPEWEKYIWWHTQEECQEQLLKMQECEISHSTADLLAGYMRRARRYY